MRVFARFSVTPVAAIAGGVAVSAATLGIDPWYARAAVWLVAMVVVSLVPYLLAMVRCDFLLAEASRSTASVLKEALRPGPPAP